MKKIGHGWLRAQGIHNAEELKMHILIIDGDDHRLVETAQCLRELCGSAHLRSDANIIAQEDIEDGDYDLILVTTVLSQIPAPLLIQHMRGLGIHTPVISLVYAERADTVRKSGVDCLRAGADDFLKMPFYVPELLARIKAVLNRSVPPKDRMKTISIGDFNVHPEMSYADIGGVRVKLTRKEYALIEVLAKAAGRPVSKAAIMSIIYGVEEEQPAEKIIDVFVCKIRRKIREMTGGHDYIKTVWGRGFAIEAQADEKEAA